MSSLPPSKNPPMEDQEEIWASVIKEIIRDIPPDWRERVICEVMTMERPSLVIKATPFVLRDPGTFRLDNAKNEARSVLIQILVSAITNSHSPEGAAKVLFKRHAGLGHGSGWLPDYLAGLPGIQVNEKKCAALADKSVASKLRFAKVAEDAEA
ncbi:MAG TPA: hypothetical protein VFX37_15215 [Pseudolabrys sp.]|nr:hypothetical protein [Pseudolabrys sp.]